MKSLVDRPADLTRSKRILWGEPPADLSRSREHLWESCPITETRSRDSLWGDPPETKSRDSLWGDPPEKKNSPAFKVRTTESMIRDSLNIESFEEETVVIPIEGKSIISVEVRNFTNASHTVQGKHHENEDRVKILPNFLDIGYYAIFDGHGGHRCADWMTESLHTFLSKTEQWKQAKFDEALKQGFLDAEKAFLEKAISLRDPTGTCALVAIFHNQTKSLYVGNVGDSRAVLCRGGQVVELSKDLKPANSQEFQRILSKGGKVVNGRVNGLLAVSRSLGGKELKIGKLKGPVIPHPQVYKTQLVKEDEFLLMACDGLFDVFSSQEAINFIKNELQKDTNLNQICEKLVNEAVKRGSEDDITLIIVKF